MEQTEDFEEKEPDQYYYDLEDLEIAELNQQAKDDAYREHQESNL